MRIQLLNCAIDAITMDQTISIIEKAILEKKQIHHVVVNVAKLVHLQKDSVLKDSVVNCDIINADGQGVVWAASFLGKKIPERVTGIDLMYNLIKLSATKGYKIFLFGAHEEIVKKVNSLITSNFGPNLVVGYRNGYFSLSEEKNIANEIAEVKPNILFVAMGSPKKERFLYENKDILKDVNLIMGVGGSFDVFAGKVKRAPLWMQKTGLEWFYRLQQEPRRMFYRYFTTNIKLIYLLLREKISNK